MEAEFLQGITILGHNRVTILIVSEGRRRTLQRPSRCTATGRARQALGLGPLDDIQDGSHLLDGELAGSTAFPAGQGREGSRGSESGAD